MVADNSTLPNPLQSELVFSVRPWVRRAGASILAVAAGATVVFAALRLGSSTAYWTREPATWLYLLALWVGGLKVYLASRASIAEMDAQTLFVRPIHVFGARRIPWDRILGIEQMIGGDRMIIYYQSERGMRFVALNLNLVKGRREMVRVLEDRLRELGFVEKIVDRSRYLSRPAS